MCCVVCICLHACCCMFDCTCGCACTGMLAHRKVRGWCRFLLPSLSPLSFKVSHLKASWPIQLSGLPAPGIRRPASQHWNCRYSTTLAWHLLSTGDPNPSSVLILQQKVLRSLSDFCSPGIILTCMTLANQQLVYSTSESHWISIVLSAIIFPSYRESLWNTALRNSLSKNESFSWCY